MDNLEKIKKYLSNNFDQYEIYEESSNLKSISFESNSVPILLFSVESL